MRFVVHQEKQKGGKSLGNSESAVEATKDVNPTGPLGGRSQA
jgi:hypothetical protein